MSQLTVETGDAFTTLLELAANNDTEGFMDLTVSDPSGIDEVGLWYGRQKGSKQMVLEHRTPLMVASMYGSLDVLKLILERSKADVNRLCGVDKTTALHCAASGGSVNAAEIVKLLLAAGADPNLIDVNGFRPVDVIMVSPKFPDMKKSLEELLGGHGDGHGDGDDDGDGDESSPSSLADLILSPKTSGFNDTKREYPVDPSLPDIKNSIYSTDEFRMYSFKVRPCSRAYSHDWTECPFVHPGENARRRDPRKYHYSCVPCPDFRKGTCRRGDMCEYAHGVFECWLHPAQYRTRLCKDGTTCNRRVCFFAHTQDELRPLFVSTGSAVPSPRSGGGSGGGLDFAAAMSLMPPFTPPMSPSSGMSNMNWPQPNTNTNIPSLHLPGSNLQSSRLRSSLNAREQDLNLQLLNELSRQQRADIFSAESSSPRHNSSVFNQFQQQQGMLSPINTSFSVQSPGRMSPRSVDPISPMSSRVSMLARENQHQQFRSLSSRELGSRAGTVLVDPWSKWGEKPEWGSSPDELGKLRRSSSFENGGSNGEEPDLSWVQSLVKETPQEKLAAYGGGSGGGAGGDTGGSGSNVNVNEQMDQSTLSAWIEQMQLDHLVAQEN